MANPVEQLKSQNTIPLVEVLRPQALAFLISVLGPSVASQHEVPLLTDEKARRGGKAFTPGAFDTRPLRAGNQ